MHIYNETALQEARELIKMDIKICKRLIVSPAKPGLKKYNKARLSTLQNIKYWLDIHA